MVQGQHWNQNNVCSKLSIKTKNDIFIVDVVDAGWDPQKYVIQILGKKLYRRSCIYLWFIFIHKCDQALSLKVITWKFTAPVS